MSHSRERGSLRLQEASIAADPYSHARFDQHFGGRSLRALPTNANGDKEVRVSTAANLFAHDADGLRFLTLRLSCHLRSEPKVKKVENAKFKEEEEAVS